MFFDYDRGVPANLLEASGTHRDLYEALKQRSEMEAKIASKWEQEHPKRTKAML